MMCDVVAEKIPSKHSVLVRYSVVNYQRSDKKALCESLGKQDGKGRR
jgi:hypothetical protein